MYRDRIFPQMDSLILQHVYEGKLSKAGKPVYAFGYSLPVSPIPGKYLERYSHGSTLPYMFFV